jgi:phosphatidate cytidylyltransferase
MNNFWQRTITGFTFVVILIGGIWFSEYSFYALFLLITILASKEFYQIVEKNGNIQLNKVGGIAASAILFSAVFYSRRFSPQDNTYLLIYFLFMIALILSELYRKKENPINNWAYLIMGQVFVALPFSLLNLLVFPICGASFNPLFLLSLFVLIWANDTFAYLFGVSFGKHRLFERISPKKSWEGFIGGTICTLALGFVLAKTIGQMDTFRWLGFAAIVVAFGTWGDLTESLLKRTLDIKDSGNILPGHGGLLDRFDSLLLAVPVIAIYLQFVL